MWWRYEPAYVFTEGELKQDWAVLIDEETGRIVAVGERHTIATAYPDSVGIVWPDRLLMPGTVNVHAHAFQHLARGRGGDQPFLRWRDETLYHITPHLDPEALYLGSKLAFIEMLESGITSVAEFFYIHGAGIDNDRAIIQAALDTGIRLVLARTFYDWDGAPFAYRESIDEAVRRTQILAQEVADNRDISLHIAPHSLHGASDDMIRTAHALSRDLSVPCHIHVAEEQFEVDEVLARTGHTPVGHLDALGVLGPETIAVHLVCLSPDDINLITTSHTRWAYCPSSNLFLADGIAPLPELVNGHVITGLGTDGGCSNNRASVFEEMRMAALVHKGTRQDATVLTSGTVLDMGTRMGADLLRLPTGVIAPGYWADFIGIDLHHPSLIPWINDTLMANVVYAMQPAAIQEVIVGGRPMIVRGSWQNGDRRELINQVQALVRQWQ